MGGRIARRFLLVAGESSGDLHAARLVRALRVLGPCEIRGVAGPALRAAGAEPLMAMEELAILGFAEIPARLPALLKARARLLRAAETDPPDAVVLVDYPGFNLRLGPELKRRGAKIFYYIAPQIWAWRAGRAKAMARWVDHLAVVFPFEEAMFRAAGVRTTFVGHPLLDELAPEVDEPTLRSELGATPAQPIVGLLPGSRPQEVDRHLSILVAAAAILKRRRPDLIAVMPVAPGLDADRLGGAALSGVHVVRERTRAVQAYASVCAVASGTATLETALFGTPLVVLYRTGWLDYAIARRVVRLEHIGLPNILAGRVVAPELIQAALTPESLAAALARPLEDTGVNAAQRRDLAVVRERLGGPGASDRAAALLWSLAG